MPNQNAGFKKLHDSFPIVKASVSQPVKVKKSTVWLHVHVNRSPIKAWAEAWTTKQSDPNSPRIKVGSIRLILEWVVPQDSTVKNASLHEQWEWNTAGAFKSAKATAWTSAPSIGPVSAKTSF